MSKKAKPTGTICVKGTFTDEGVECQAFRSIDGDLYTLLGDLKGFQNGDEAVVCGTIAEVSFCMQGTTISVSWIGKEAPKAIAKNINNKGGSSTMLTDEQSSQIVEACIKRVSHVGGVDFNDTLDAAGIIDDVRVNTVVSLIVHDPDIGVPSQNHQINGGFFNGVTSDTIVDDVINIVMTKAT